MNGTDLIDFKVFEDMDNHALVLEVDYISDLVSAHSMFQGLWPECVPSPPIQKSLTQRLRGATAAAVNKDTAKTAERNALRAETLMSHRLMGQYVIMMAISKNDLSIIEQTGYPLKVRNSTKTSTASDEVLPPPTKFEVKHTKESGTLELSGTQVKGAHFYYIQMCKGEPTGEGSWQELDVHKTIKSILVRGLVPGQIYYFRIRSRGANGPGPWSAPICIMVI